MSSFVQAVVVTSEESRVVDQPVQMAANVRTQPQCSGLGKETSPGVCHISNLCSIAFRSNTCDQHTL